MSTLSAIFSKLSIIFNLSLTFAPPNIAITGLLGLLVIFDKFSNSFWTKNPTHDV
jgi:xanthosine utilization system XapX-like protein